MIKAVIIDFDDTLCLTEAACFELENAVLESMGRAPMSREIHVGTWGRPLFDAIVDRSPGIDVEAFKAAYHPMIAAFLRDGRLDEIPAVNYKALEDLAKQDMQLYLLTSRTFAELKHILEPSHRLATHIKGFYHKDNTRFHKPNPKVFDELFADNSLAPEECVYIGDSMSDATASKEAGLYFVASLESGLRQKTDFNANEVDAFINTFPDIVEAIAGIGKK